LINIVKLYKIVYFLSWKGVILTELSGKLEQMNIFQSACVIDRQNNRCKRSYCKAVNIIIGLLTKLKNVQTYTTVSSIIN